MDFEKLPIKIICKNALLESELTICEEAPDDPSKVLIEMYYNNQKLVKMADSFFEALQSLRLELEADNIQILCNGSAKNVYPSPMLLAMGSGKKAYLLKLGEPAKNADIIDIFDCAEGLSFVSVEEQMSFHKFWLQSLR